MINLKKLLQKSSLAYTLTGLSPREFRSFAKKFEQALEKKKGGQKTDRYLATPAEKLFFVLFYYTVHPTYKLIKTVFGFSAKTAKDTLETLMPLVEKSLARTFVRSRHRVGTLKDLYAEFSVPKNIFTLGIPRGKKGAAVKKVALSGEPSADVADSAPRKDAFPLLFQREKEKTEPPLLLETEVHTLLAKPQAPVAQKFLPQTTEDTQAVEKEKSEQEKKRIEELIKKEIAQQVEHSRSSLVPPPLPFSPLQSTPSSLPSVEPLAGQTLPSVEPPAERSELKPVPEKTFIPKNVYQKPSEEFEEKKPAWVEKVEKKVAQQNVAREAPITYPHKAEEVGEVKGTKINLSEKLAEIKNKINEQLKKSSDELSIIEFVDALIQEGFYSGASDVHIEPEEKDVVARLRIDGVLHDVVIYPKIIHSAVITRIKVIAGLRTDEHQAAQDGRFKLSAGQGFIDIRVSIAPTYYGENTVMRVLTQQKELSLQEIGLTDDDLEKAHSAAGRPHGMILSCGPTGSGKTTTLYAIIKLLNTRDVSIITIEDPIEYSIGGIDQIQVNPKTGLTFADGLRSILRQDPDILMVGEIRDEDTAHIAVNAALTGHLLLSTLHTNDAPTALPRLVDMGVEPFLVASTVNVIIGQRLVRRICDHCKESYTLTEDNLNELNKLVNIETFKGNTKFYRGRGCAVCGESGYKGRVGIYEVLEMAENIRALVMSRASSDDIKYVAIKNGMTTMLDDGIKKAIAGITTIEEVLRVARE